MTSTRAAEAIPRPRCLPVTGGFEFRAGVGGSIAPQPAHADTRKFCWSKRQGGSGQITAELMLVEKVKGVSGRSARPSYSKT